jgi:hypothetical protein
VPGIRARASLWAVKLDATLASSAGQVFVQCALNVHVLRF